MKKLLATLPLFLGSIFGFSQNGLKNIIVERYYIVTKADSIWAATSPNSDATNGGAPRVGTVCYRIYANMLPGYKFETVYGNSNHTLSLSTSTQFFNSDNGSDVPNNSYKNLKNGLEMIDSYFSVGLATTGSGTTAYMAMPKVDQIGTNTVVNTYASSGVLQGTNTAQGLPLTLEDGLIQATLADSAQPVTFVGIAADSLNVFLDGTANASTFTCNNGAISSLSHSKGADSNKVFLGQFTTDGQFCYNLNIQITSPAGVAQKYVASNAQAGEILMPSLSGCIGGRAVLPTVNITSPAPNASIITGTSINFTANAAEVAGGISSVQFFEDGRYIGLVLNAPYTLTDTSGPGTHIVTAVVTDINGNQVTSAGVTYTVSTPSAPVVSITNPMGGSTYVAGDTVLITASATNVGQTISNVKFYVNHDSIGTALTSPYSIKWPSIAGKDTITAVATNNIGLKTTSSYVAITVNQYVAPTVAITSPGAGVNKIVGDQVAVTASASDANLNGSITLVEFYVNNMSIATLTSAPYSTSFFASLGNDTIRAVATDNRGGKTTSAYVVVKVGNDVPPMITITSPNVSDSIITGDNVSVAANVISTNTGGSITSVSFYNNASLINTVTTAPYTVKYNATAGMDTIRVIATDNRGGIDTAMIVLNVLNDVPPTIAITSPKNGRTVVLGDMVTITSIAKDIDTLGTITSVVYYVNHKAIGSSATSSNGYRATWTSNLLGNDTLVAVATDGRGVSAPSAPIILHVVKEIPPMVTITSPSASTIFEQGAFINIAATASDADTLGSISSVAFYVNGSLVSTAITAPYTYSYVANSLGLDTIVAIATDNRGGKDTSAKVIVLVNNSTGIATINNSTAFNLFPNPTQNQVKLIFSTTSATIENSYTIYSIDGRMLTHKELGLVQQNQVETLDFSSLNAGIYFVEVTLNGNRVTKRVIKN